VQSDLGENGSVLGNRIPMFLSIPKLLALTLTRGSTACRSLAAVMIEETLALTAESGYAGKQIKLFGVLPVARRNRLFTGFTHRH